MVTAPATTEPRQVRPLLVAGLAGLGLHVLLTLVLWLAANVVAARTCLENAFGLAVSGGGSSITETGCAVTVPTIRGPVVGHLETFDQGLATLALVVALSVALWPLGSLLVLARRRPSPWRSRVLVAFAGVGLHLLVAMVLWVGADATATRSCLEGAFGLDVEGSSIAMTEAGCTVSLPTIDGRVSATLPTFDQGIGTAGVLVGAAGALWPLGSLLLLARRRSDGQS